MRWPLVASSTLVAVQSERDWLRAQNARLHETVVRLARKAKGMSEVQPEKRVEMEPIPGPVRELINAFRSQHIRKAREERAIACYRQTKDWGAVMELLALPEEEA